jgi:hypothetical protein
MQEAEAVVETLLAAVGAAATAADPPPQRIPDAGLPT